jgi:hypothetical protein
LKYKDLNLIGQDVVLREDELEIMDLCWEFILDCGERSRCSHSPIQGTSKGIDKCCIPSIVYQIRDPQQSKCNFWIRKPGQRSRIMTILGIELKLILREKYVFRELKPPQRTYF